MRAQFTPLGAILVVAMIVSLIAASYVWSDSMIDKQKAYVDYVYAKNKQIEIREAVGVVAGGEGRQELVDVDLDRIWMEVEEGKPYSGTINSFTIDGNYIDFVVQSTQEVLPEDWKELDPDEPMSPVGNLGEDEGAIIVGRNENFEDRIRLWYRDLYDGEEYYRVSLKKSKPWNLESDRTTLIFTNTGNSEDSGYHTTEVTISVK